MITTETMMKNKPSKPETAFYKADLSSRLPDHTALHSQRNKVSSLKGLRIAENAYVVNDKCKLVLKVSSFKGRMN